MAFFENLKERVTDLAQTGVAKSKQLAEIAKLKTANLGEEDTIKKAYYELGKLYYAEKGSAPEGGYAAACEKITAAKAAIAANNARIEELKDGDEEVAAATEEAKVEEPAVEEAAAETAEEIPVEPPVEAPAAEEPKAE